MPFEGFIHPALAFGALLAAVPLVIHLLNRQRHRPLAWAAMRFVQAAYRRTRRRAQLENLLLLLLRMAAVGLLAFAVARPFTGRDSPLAPLTESRRDLVLILDASASTAYRESVESVFERSLARAREILARLEGNRGDRVRLVAAAARPRLLSARSPEDALAVLPTLTEPTPEALDLASTLAEVVAWAREEAGDSDESSLEVRLLTDLQLRSFRPPDGLSVDPDVDAGSEAPGGEEGDEGPNATAPLQRALDELGELGVPVVVEDLGAGLDVPPNVGIQALSPIGEIRGPGLPTDIAVRIKNQGSAGRANVRVALEVDGDRLPSQKIDLGARETLEVPFSVTFRQGGLHTVQARLEGDRLAFDDTRAGVVAVPPPIDVLLVNGDQADDVDRDEVGYLKVVLSPPDDGSVGLFGGISYAPFRIHEQVAAAFDGQSVELGEMEVVVLANVGPLLPDAVERLEERVAAGAVLVITLGDRFEDPAAVESFNARFYRPDGTGLLPARLRRHVSVPSRRDARFRAAEFDGEHPVLSFFDDERWRPFWTEVPVFEFLEVEPLEDAHVLSRLDDPGSSPLLLERPYDRGRVFLWTTSIDADWNLFPELPTSFVPFAHELVRQGVLHDGGTREVEVGTDLILETEGFPRSPVAVRPDGSRNPIDGEPVEIASGLWRLPAVPTGDHVGLWSIELEGAELEPFAVRADPSEGDLERLPPEALESLHPTWKLHRTVDGGEDGPAEDPERGELWRWLAALCLAALCAETLWAAWIGHGRRAA